MARRKAEDPKARTERLGAGMEEQMDSLTERLAEKRKVEKDPHMHPIWERDIAFLKDERKALDRIVRVMRYTELQLETSDMAAALREERKGRRKAAEPDPATQPAPAAPAPETPARPAPAFNLNTSGS